MSIEKDRDRDDKNLAENSIAQFYKQEIEEAIAESEHVYRLTIDYEILDLKINQILESARADGFGEKRIWDLLFARIPSYANYVNYKVSGKKSA